MWTQVFLVLPRRWFFTALTKSVFSPFSSFYHSGIFIFLQRLLPLVYIYRKHRLYKVYSSWRVRKIRSVRMLVLLASENSSTISSQSHPKTAGDKNRKEVNSHCKIKVEKCHRHRELLYILRRFDSEKGENLVLRNAWLRIRDFLERKRKWPHLIMPLPKGLPSLHLFLSLNIFLLSLSSRLKSF